MKNIPSQGYRHQSVKLWNSKTSVDIFRKIRKKFEKNLLYKLMNFNYSLISLKSEDVSVSNGVLILK
jgi:hypothetical protein